MKHQTWILWGVAVFITVGTAVFQRITGPTYPMSGEVLLGEERVGYVLKRSEEQKNAVISIPVSDAAVTGRVEWRRHLTDDPWSSAPMVNADVNTGVNTGVNGKRILTGELPVQPPAGKLDYRVVVEKAGATAQIPAGEPAVIRFKGGVPLGVLIPHVIVIFMAMLLSTRAGLEFFAAEPKLKGLSLWTVVFLFVGGLVLGPLVQKYAFDAYWTGWPFGTDLTDNKTAVALLGWVAAAIGIRRSKYGGRWALVAALILLIVFLIPHSLFGSSLQYSKMGGS